MIVSKKIVMIVSKKVRMEKFRSDWTRNPLPACRHKEFVKYMFPGERKAASNGRDI